MAGGPVGKDDLLLLGFGELVAQALGFVRPVRGANAMQEQDVEVLGIELLAEAIYRDLGSSCPRTRHFVMSL
jgi:hypothetical protein